MSDLMVRDFADDQRFHLVLTCAECGKELNRSISMTKKDYTSAVLSGPICTGPCPNGCRSTFSDLNMNTRQRIELETKP